MPVLFKRCLIDGCEREEFEDFAPLCSQHGVEWLERSPNNTMQYFIDRKNEERNERLARGEAP